MIARVSAVLLSGSVGGPRDDLLERALSGEWVGQTSSPQPLTAWHVRRHLEPDRLAGVRRAVPPGGGQHLNEKEPAAAPAQGIVRRRQLGEGTAPVAHLDVGDATFDGDRHVEGSVGVMQGIGRQLGDEQSHRLVVHARAEDVESELTSKGY